MRFGYTHFLLAIFLSASSLAASQRPSSDQQKNQSQPTYHVTMIPRAIMAINYQGRKSTEIGFQGSPLMPTATGKAKISSETGHMSISAEFRNLEAAQKFGPEYLTYVLWAITPQGKTTNLGEVALDKDKGKIEATTPLQTFGLIVTAEPYFAVSEPSDAVVLENVALRKTSGEVQQVNSSYQLLGRGQYSNDVATANESRSNPKVPL